MKIIYLLFISFYLYSCSSTDKKLIEYRKELYQKQFKKAEKLLNESKIKKDKDSKLLFLIEKATLSFHKGEYQKAVGLFTQTLDLYDQLYTKSISKKIKASVLNSNFSEFTGSAYEISMIYYHQAMSYYFLAEQAKEAPKRSAFLGQMRATVVAWDSFFKTLKRSPDPDNKIFLDDFFARITGASMHELLNTRREREISYVLYQDALKILEATGATLKIYNSDYQDYIKALLDKNKKQLKKSKKFNENYQALEHYLQTRIIALALELRPREVKKLVKKYNFKKEELASLTENKKKVPLTFFIGVKPLPEKIPDKVNISLRGAYENTKDPGTRALIKGVALPVLTIFASRSLGLESMTTYGYRNNLYMRNNVMEAFMGDFGIAFELPRYPDQDFEYNKKIKIYDEKNKLILTTDLILTGPIYSLAKQDLDQQLVSEYWRTGTRVAFKYMAAMAAAYTLYEVQQKKKDASGFGQLAVLASYYAATRAIQASEQADLRNWGSLPANIFSNRVYLSPGSYMIRLESATQVKELGKVQINANSPAIFSTITN